MVLQPSQMLRNIEKHYYRIIPLHNTDSDVILSQHDIPQCLEQAVILYENNEKEANDEGVYICIY